MIPEKAKPVLGYITANPGCSNGDIMAALGMTRGMVSDRLSMLLGCDAAHAVKVRGGHGRVIYRPGPKPVEGRAYRSAPASSHVDGRPMRVTLPPAPFDIPPVDRSETAPRARSIRVDLEISPDDVLRRPMIMRGANHDPA